LASQFEIVVRYQGGANAGHTVVSQGRTYKLHHIPSGILHPGITNVVAPGVVIHPPKLLEELRKLQKYGIRVTPENLMLSERAHLVCPWHLREEQLANRESPEGEAIGTTQRGIGPCYRDKVGRTQALRLGDLARPDLEDRVRRIAAEKRSWLHYLHGDLPESDDQLVAEFVDWARELGPFIANTTEFVLDRLEQGAEVLFEGAQGALLDIDHGTYPFVTSSNSSGVGISAGSGVAACWIRRVIGVIKIYSTRVGGGPFPTELTDAAGDRIREQGREYGTTTGRPRRCGWFDAVAARYTARLSGVSELAAMMLDVLSGFETVQICVAYEVDGVRTTRFPSEIAALRRARPIWESLPGWQGDLSDLRSWSDLPLEARRYLARLEALIGVPVSIISVGPDRQQTILRLPGSTVFA
jgi:adenylosuccinate synthase